MRRIRIARLGWPRFSIPILVLSFILSLYVCSVWINRRERGRACVCVCLYKRVQEEEEEEEENRSIAAAGQPVLRHALSIDDDADGFRWLASLITFTVGHRTSLHAET